MSATGYFHSTNGSACSLLIRFCIVFFCGVGLGGCADVKGPQWLTGEPSDRDLQMTTVQAPEKRELTKSNEWPNLGEVPSQKPKFSTVKELQARADHLKAEQVQAQADGERILDIPLDGGQTSIQPSVAKPFSFSALKP
ncbi:MAG: hypothetical protein EOM37_01940 [Proteobacteria bacterium]|nr:hypothetical protein [Alphaproteobacteria bacterium]NCC02796.1 hypothetical protein [Pseudomonadota bacterium]